MKESNFRLPFLDTTFLLLSLGKHRKERNNIDLPTFANFCPYFEEEETSFLQF